MEKQEKRTIPTIPIQKAVVFLIWAGVLAVLFTHRAELTVDGIASLLPRNLFLAALVMLGLFALKSLSLVVYCGLLYAADGILFPLPLAIFINLLGTVIMVSLPYAIGKRKGALAVEQLRKKYPRLKDLHQHREGNALALAYLARMARLPSDIVSLYMGAVSAPYRQYLLGSLLGLLPHMITFPIMGMGVQDMGSPAFLISFFAELAYVAASAVFFAIYHRIKTKAHAVSQQHGTDKEELR